MHTRLISQIAASCLVAMTALSPIGASAQTIRHEMGEVTFDAQPTRFAGSNWAMTESLLALGIDPVAVPEADGYRVWVVEPQLPATFADLGTRREPNFEALREAKPDAILIGGEMAMAYDKLSGVAPTLVYSIYDTGKDTPAIDNAESLLRNIGTLAGKSDKAEEVIASANARIDAAAARIRDHLGKDAKFTIVRINDEAHFRIHGKTSLFGSTLARMGFANAWEGEVNGWGFHNGDVSDLAKMGDVQFAYVEPIAPTVQSRLFDTAIWKAMPFTRNDHVYAVPASWTFGGLLSAARFAELLADAVTGTQTTASGS
ncbi:MULTISPECIES: iron-siderophore ABC transporter substrate-binding protein [Thalassospira]|uniref:Ferrichrome ABC transporter substrate-binding protein n=2 Tax=Thalassospira TaxID=168934 RepID=A0A367W8P0_9PROT|nr:MULTISPECIES: iron-siderophore ABC transporter substrate-binding protein [Thalassospira]MDG4718002.1 iron-siderophore ABC transporter substrate-binding protein [Thalassospira sp. FZY0004]RCK37783.1 ferrichrome ABC transporter substrate-binding protein [Thalassospira profundimaris]